MNRQPSFSELIERMYGTGGLKALASDLRIPYMTVVNTVKAANYTPLQAFIECSARLGVDADELLPVLDYEGTEERKNWLKRRLGIDTISKMSVAGEADQYLYSLLLGRSGRPVKRIYRPMAKKFSLTISELYQILIASQIQAA